MKVKLTKTLISEENQQLSVLQSVLQAVKPFFISLCTA